MEIETTKMTRNPPSSPNLIPWTLRFFIFILTFVLNTARRSNGTVNRPIMKVFDSKTPPSNKPDNVRTTDVMADPSRNLWFRLFVPTTATTTRLPVIIYFHGGGFVFFSANSTFFESICKRLSLNLPAVVISVNYQLAPEHRYPAAFEDGFDVMKFVDTSNFEGFPSNADLSRCFLAGDSAGGNMAHHLAVMAGTHEFSRIKLIGIIGIQPFFGGEERTESEIKLNNKALILSLEITDWYWKAFLPVGEDRDHPVVNVFGPRSDDVLGLNFPATIFFIGGLDLLKDGQKRYCEGLKKAGKEVYMVEYPNAFHGFYCFPQLKEWSLLVEVLKDFIEKQLDAH